MVLVDWDVLVVVLGAQPLTRVQAIMNIMSMTTAILPFFVFNITNPSPISLTWFL
jgi:hypothetical protein